MLINSIMCHWNLPVPHKMCTCRDANLGKSFSGVIMVFISNLRHFSGVKKLCFRSTFRNTFSYIFSLFSCTRNEIRKTINFYQIYQISCYILTSYTQDKCYTQKSKMAMAMIWSDFNSFGENILKISLKFLFLPDILKSVIFVFPSVMHNSLLKSVKTPQKYWWLASLSYLNWLHLPLWIIQYEMG